MTADHGFDTTDFGGWWATFSYKAGLTFVGRTRGGAAFEWRTLGGASFVTQNNPVTGEYGPGDALRERQIGYASYIGISGPEAEVERVAALVREWAVDCGEGSTGNRPFI